MASTPALTAASTALEAAVDLGDVDWDGLDGPDALATVVALGRLKAVVDGALVAVAERLEETGAADAAGWASTKDLLTHVLGGRKGAGAAFVRVAERTADLPAVRAALAAGEISLAQAGVIWAGQSGPALPKTSHPDPPDTLAGPPRPDHPQTGVDPTTTSRRPRPVHLPPANPATTPRGLSRT